MTYIDMFGFIAAFLTSASFIPQAVMVIKARNTDGLSLVMYAMFTTGICMWFSYGFLTKAWPLIIANSVTIVLATSILSIIIMNKFKARKSLQAYNLTHT